MQAECEMKRKPRLRAGVNDTFGNIRRGLKIVRTRGRQCDNSGRTGQLKKRRTNRE